MEKRELFYIAGENVNWCRRYGKQHEGFSKKKLTVEPPYYSVIPLLGICLGKTVTGKDTGTRMFTIYISQDMKVI